MENHNIQTTIKTKQRSTQLDLKIHLLVFLCVNAILFIINLSTGYAEQWHLWVLFGMLIPLGIHMGVKYAIKKYTQKGFRSVAIHAAVVISTNLALFGINVLGRYQYPWHFWPLIAMLLGFTIHDVCIFSSSRISDKLFRSIAIHGGVFISTSIALGLVNLLTGIGTIWFIYVVLAWLIGIATHVSVGASIRLIEKRSNRALLISGTVLLFVGLYLAFIDFATNRQFNWIIYALIPLALAWINHYIIYLITTTRPNQEMSKFKKMQVDVKNTLPSGSSVGKMHIFRYVSNKVIFINGLLIFLLVSCFLFIVNVNNGGIQPENAWSIISFVSWGNMVVLHGYSIVIWKKTLYKQVFSVFSMFGFFISMSLAFILREYAIGFGFNVLRIVVGELIVLVSWLFIAGIVSSILKKNSQ